MTLGAEELFRLFFALVLGGLIGTEREFRDKAAGFCTMILISMGSALFTMLSMRLGQDTNVTRIAANVVSGIGFLGAGVILRERGRITGLTTAATIWIVAALGMGAGAGEYLLVSVAGLTVLAVFLGLRSFEHWIDRMRENRIYEVRCKLSLEKWEVLDARFRNHKLRVIVRKQEKVAGEMLCTWDAHGAPKNHALLVAEMLQDPDVLDMRY